MDPEEKISNNWVTTNQENGKKISAKLEEQQNVRPGNSNEPRGQNWLNRNTRFSQFGQKNCNYCIVLAISGNAGPDQTPTTCRHSLTINFRKPTLSTLTRCRYNNLKYLLRTKSSHLGVFSRTNKMSTSDSSTRKLRKPQNAHTSQISNIPNCCRNFRKRVGENTQGLDSNMKV